MPILEIAKRLLTTILRLVVWALAAALALGLVGLAVVFLLTWLLVGLILGRKPQISLRSRVQRMREFGDNFGPKSFKREGFWNSQVRPQEGGRSTAPLAQRMTSSGTVQDVEVKETQPRSRD